jgi:hypothetical protein
MGAVPMPAENVNTLKVLAARHGFSLEAAQTLWQSLEAGGGTMAQFRHPELGGTGQWTQGGLIMIGDMFNHALKARVESLCSELAFLLQRQEVQDKNDPNTIGTEKVSYPWWGTDLGTSAASGSQNNIRYAYFPGTQRLAVLQEDRVTIYDTGSHHITGVSQQQSSIGSLTFISQHGAVRLADLRVVSESGKGMPSPATPETNSAAAAQLGQERSAEIFYRIERLAELRDKGILSEEEFSSKKTELLARL